MKKTLLLFIALITSLGLYAETVATPPTSGDGSEENPYQIENLAHLRWLSENESVWDKQFIQTGDIDASETASWNDGEGFDPIGGLYSNPFTGIYNGNYHKIKNLYINRPDEQWIGLFGYTSRARIEKLSLEDVDIVGYYIVGGLVGRVMDSSHIYQTSVTGKIEGKGRDIGGICGQSIRAKIEESYSNAIIKGYNSMGGITSISSNSTIKNCYSLSSFIVKDDNSFIPYYSGGITGEDYGHIANCYYAGPGAVDYGISKTEDFLDKNIIINFWDSEKAKDAKKSTSSDPKTTSEMKDPYLYFDSQWKLKVKNYESVEIWNIGNGRNNGYPYLSWQYPNDEGCDVYAKPNITIDYIKLYSNTEAVVSMTISDIGNEQVLEYGICYGFKESPTIDDNKILLTENIKNGATTLFRFEIEDEKLYYVRAYITDNVDTYYSDSLYISSIIEKEPKGNGTAEKPYQISSLSELLWLTENPDSWDKQFIQTENIDASVTKGFNNNKGLYPIGGYNDHFTGIYNGNYHKIENLHIVDEASDNIGFFGTVKQAKIEKLVLDSLVIIGNKNVGGIVGFADESHIFQTKTSGKIQGEGNIGGLIGHNLPSNIEESFSTSTIYADSLNAGGLIGYNEFGNIINSFSKSYISSYKNSGGLIGYNAEVESKIKFSYSASTFNKVSLLMGGILAEGEKPSVEHNVYWDWILSDVNHNNGFAEKMRTVAMKEKSTYEDSGWNLNNNNDGIWTIYQYRNDGYPILLWSENSFEIQPNNIKDSFLIGPNPFDENITVYGNNINYISISTLFGTRVFQLEFDNQSEITIPTHSFVPGIYLIYIESEDGVKETHKLIKR